MEPSNLTFIGLVCLLAAALSVATLWLWSRVSGGGLKRIGARTLLLGGSQIALTLAITLLVNRWFVFYNTWDDLFGPVRANAKVQSVQPSRGKETTLGQLVKHSVTTLGPHHPNRPADPKLDGRVDKVQITGATTGLTTEAYVYLPAAYFQPQNKGKRLPVVMAISGGTGTSDDKLAWIRQAHLPEQASKLTASNKAQPVVYVMMRSVKGLTQASTPPAGDAPKGGPSGRPTGTPSGGGVKPPAASGSHPASCLNLPGKGYGQALDFYAQDVPLALGEVYHLPYDHKGWGVVGFGTSGQCAARLAMTDSARFGTAVAVNGVFDLSAEVPTAGLASNDTPGQNGPSHPADPFGGSKVFRQEQDLYWRLEHMAPPPVSMLVTAGSNGRQAQQADRFASLAKAPLRVDKTLTPVTAETLAAWRGQVPQIVTWLSGHLQGE
ncbi:hypothetical protein [Actinomadura harenae]|uniref:Esterase n=1 Tax=Actinomadura harenae TaxID=2483351 RepID=A0A3M2LRI6_9ACTN|nr:hypothetical protein [Actinomadura harenae]RMI40061.1 hypothetical protein EBO15_27900 [Actinomadura harenae]